MPRRSSSSSLVLDNIVNNNDEDNDSTITPLRVTTRSSRKSATIDLAIDDTPPIRTRRMVTRGRKVSLSPIVFGTPSPTSTRSSSSSSNAKIALALSKSILATPTSSKKRRASPSTSSQKKKQRPVVGRWEEWEQIEFLKGLREHGRGNWKVIAESIPTRTTVQVKTHAQVELKKFDSGVNIFEELDEYLRKEEAEEFGMNEEAGSTNENAETQVVDLTDDDEDLVVAPKTPKKKKKTPKKKSAKKKKTPPKQKTPKAKVDPSFILSPRTAAMHNEKTPLISNKSFGRAASECSALSFMTASSVTATTSSFRRYQQATGSIGFPSLTATGTLPSSFFHFPLPPLPTSARATAVHPYMTEPAPPGSFFGLYEAANALLGLSDSSGSAGSGTGAISRRRW